MRLFIYQSVKCTLTSDHEVWLMTKQMRLQVEEPRDEPLLLCIERSQLKCFFEKCDSWYSKHIQLIDPRVHPDHAAGIDTPIWLKNALHPPQEELEDIAGGKCFGTTLLM